MRNKRIQKELLILLKELVKIDTSYPPGNSDKFDKFVRNYLKTSKLKINSYYDKDKKRLNTVVKNHTDKAKSIVFNSHIDTVKPIYEEWKTNPYLLRVTNNFSYGLGAVNCKASAAVQLYIAKNLKKKI